MEEIIIYGLYGFITGIIGMILLGFIYAINLTKKTVNSWEEFNKQEIKNIIKAMKELNRSTEMFMIEKMAIDGAITWDEYMRLNRMEDKEFYEWQEEYFK